MTGVRIIVFFGMQMPDRCYDGGYDYGFNGMERQEDIYAGANAYDFGARILDPRLGRWFSRDPKATKYPSMSPYNTFGGNPILFIDPDGEETNHYKVVYRNNKPVITLTKTEPNSWWQDLIYGVDSYNNVNDLGGAHYSWGTFGYYKSESDGHNWEKEFKADPISFLNSYPNVDSDEEHETAFSNGFHAALGMAAMAYIGAKAAKAGILKHARSNNKSVFYNSSVANKSYPKGTRAPWKSGSFVVESSTKNAEKYVRVINSGNSPEGSWLMKAKDIKGLSPAQITDKFALPEMPTSVVDVVVPAGTRIRTGTAGKINGWGKGGGKQTELLERIPDESFSKPRPLPAKG